MDDSGQEKFVSGSRYDRQRELTKRRLLFWARRLQLMPHEVEKMSDGELNQRWQIIKREEDTFDNRQALFDRWKQLHELRYLMYEEQKKYNERYGLDGASIWCILAMAQQDLERKLQIDRLRGSCQRFPSPMCLMEEERQSGGKQLRLEPLKSILIGYESDSEDELKLKKVTRYIPTRWSKQGNYEHLNSKPEIHDYCKEPIEECEVNLSKKKCNLFGKSEDSFKSLREPPTNLGFCPLCAERHLRLPPRF
ncbi:uncharacterized protein LOC108028269 [Drosophila biarmipes]|uniref:uncharacterized protein LOC108028269 n=1 Tax=Drosophila biarmipes TaxID=125945 RepID=UPI0007E7B779|nr:uncharacterized protein LOC108028269 [Drosophila biarmipes]